MAATLSTRNIQALIPVEVHKVLRDIAYERNMPIKDLMCDILCDFAGKVQKEAQLKRTLSVP